MITFKELTYKNFLSTGDSGNKIYLNRTPSALITGQNGAGKSTMLDALCFGIFNKPYRNINKPQLINSVNEKGCLVEVVFDINGTEYKVERGIKPNVFNVYRNNVLIPQDASIRDYQQKLEDILGLNYRAFTQIVILGSARYQSFMDIPTWERREIIEEILDITVFSRMNSVLKSRQDTTKSELEDDEKQLSYYETRLSAQKAIIENITKRTKQSADKVQEEIDRTNGEIKLVRANISAIDSDMALIHQPDHLVRNLRESVSFGKHEVREVAKRHREKQERITFYQRETDCDVCGQEISESFKNEKVGELEAEKEILETEVVPRVREKQQEYVNQLAEAEKVAAQIQDLKLKKSEENNQLSTLENYMVTLTNNLTVDTSDSDMEKARSESYYIEKGIGNYNKSILQNKEQLHYYEACKILLKDTGIKAKIIKQYLPVINQLVNVYLEKMGATYSFHLDESFNEIIKSRYRDSFSYASFSEGEKMRIDLALMFTWREIAKLKNSVNTNLLIMDEVGDSSLDADATETLWDILSDMEDTNIFVISHKANNADRFRTFIEFMKDGNFSKIKDSK